MFTVKECTDSETVCAVCKEHGYAPSPLDRIFVLDEDGPQAVGVLSLRGAKVVVTGVFGTLDESYRDVLNRSLLHVCRCMDPITVRVDAANAYWKKFGFTETADGGMEITNTDINFKC